MMVIEPGGAALADVAPSLSIDVVPLAHKTIKSAMTATINTVRLSRYGHPYPRKNLKQPAAAKFSPNIINVRQEIAQKNVYRFSRNDSDGGKDMKSLLGGKVRGRMSDDATWHHHFSNHSHSNHDTPTDREPTSARWPVLALTCRLVSSFPRPSVSSFTTRANACQRACWTRSRKGSAEWRT